MFAICFLPVIVAVIGFTIVLLTKPDVDESNDLETDVVESATIEP